MTRRRAEDFLTDLIMLCEDHGIWLSHEDAHGSFLLTDQNTEDWLRGALAYSPEIEQRVGEEVV